MAGDGDRSCVVSRERYGNEVESVVREELTVLARSLSSRISWRLGAEMGEPNPEGASLQLDALTDGMISLMGCYGFEVKRDER